ncbi:hypothetical protein CSKR_111114 [Clonorchis sinensis]|uniref:Uncharacterized protein n=1 Tax=Clonorchis sinensis TaxID=79923 RepID=A0A419Q3G3_CLOSI|nr:hypothetical protein CSKR_111114 [Clonorchis sinensis]
MSVFVATSPVWVEVEHKIDENSGTAPTWDVRERIKEKVSNSVSTERSRQNTSIITSKVLFLVWFVSLGARWSKWLEHEFTDRKVRGSNPTFASRLPLSRLGQPGNIPALVPPSGGMVVRHRKGVDCLLAKLSVHLFVIKNASGLLKQAHTVGVSTKENSTTAPT